MARDFTKNTANYMGIGTNIIGPILNGASVISFHAWINYDTLNTTTNANRVLAILISTTNVSGVLLMVDKTGANALCRVGGRSVGSDTFQVRNGTTALLAGKWHPIGGRLDFAGSKIATFTDGNKENEGAVTFTNTSYTNGTPTSNDGIGYQGGGAPASTPNQFDGRIAEICIWNGDIGDAGFKALAAGIPPSEVGKGLKRIYFELPGRHGFEMSDDRYHIPATIKGTIPPATHPVQVQKPRRRQLYEMKAFEIPAETTTPKQMGLRVAFPW